MTKMSPLVDCEGRSFKTSGGCNLDPTVLELSRYEAEPASAKHPCLLGSTDPCPTAVHMKPFSTPALKTLI